MPKFWVVKKDTNNKYWDYFLENFGHSQYSNKQLDNYNYFGNIYCNTDLLNFKDHQYLTLEQWYNLHSLSHINLDILKTEEWITVTLLEDKKIVLKSAYIHKNDLCSKFTYFIQSKNIYWENNREVCCLTSIKNIRASTKEELNAVYKKHPELKPPKVGDLCKFWHSDLDKDIILGNLNMIYLINKVSYITNDNMRYKYAMKILPEWDYNEILKRWEIYKIIML